MASNDGYRLQVEPGRHRGLRPLRNCREHPGDEAEPRRAAHDVPADVVRLRLGLRPAGAGAGPGLAGPPLSVRTLADSPAGAARADHLSRAAGGGARQ